MNAPTPPTHPTPTHPGPTHPTPTGPGRDGLAVLSFIFGCVLMAWAGVMLLVIHGWQ